ncbi:hypothetical protein [Campylobacter ureolyticus]|nr:hypothetical protein [Campylobacter ureolyticus]MCR8699343.1 hypothetical protein [Campylobacter ureolyticus]
MRNFHDGEVTYTLDLQGGAYPLPPVFNHCYQKVVKILNISLRI